MTAEATLVERLVGGARVTPASSAGAQPTGVAVCCEAGPSAGGTFILGAGRHVVGRARAATVAIADASLEPHHGLLDVDADGTVRFVQVTGRAACRIDGLPVGAAVIVDPGAVLVIGGSRLRIGRSPSGDGCRGDDEHRDLRARDTALAAAALSLPQPTAPAAAAPTMGWPLFVSVVLAVAGCLSPWSRPLGVVLAAAGLLVGLRAARRSIRMRCARRHMQEGFDRQLDALSAQLAQQRSWSVTAQQRRAPGLVAAVNAAQSGWLPFASTTEPVFAAVVGWGETRWAAWFDTGSLADPLALARVADAERPIDGPVVAELRPGSSLTIAGVGATAVARSVIVQLAVMHGPLAWRLVLDTDAAAWAWCRELPHHRRDNGDGSVAVIVTDRTPIRSGRRGDVEEGDAIVIRVDGADPSLTSDPAAGTGARLDTGSSGIGRWTDANRPGSVAVRPCGLDIALARDCARQLAAAHRRQLREADDAELPLAVALADVCEAHFAGPADDAIAIAGAWQSGPVEPRAVVGVGRTGPTIVSLCNGDGPHAVLIGDDDAARGELLASFVLGLAATGRPDRLALVLVTAPDGPLAPCAELPHVVAVVDPRAAGDGEDVADALQVEMDRRRSIAAPPPGPVAGEVSDHLAVVVEDASMLHGRLASVLAAIARERAPVSVHAVVAGRYPDGVLGDVLAADAGVRIAMRVGDTSVAEAVVGDQRPARMTATWPGRAIVRMRTHGPTLVQSMSSGEAEAVVLIRSIRHAASLCDLAPSYLHLGGRAADRSIPGGTGDVAGDGLLDLVAAADGVTPRNLAAAAQDRALVDLGRRQHHDDDGHDGQAHAHEHGPDRRLTDGIQRRHRQYGGRRDEGEDPQQRVGAADGGEADEVGEEDRQHHGEGDPLRVLDAGDQRSGGGERAAVQGVAEQEPHQPDGEIADTHPVRDVGTDDTGGDVGRHDEDQGVSQRHGAHAEDLADEQLPRADHRQQHLDHP